MLKADSYSYRNQRLRKIYIVETQDFASLPMGFVCLTYLDGIFGLIQGYYKPFISKLLQEVQTFSADCPDASVLLQLSHGTIPPVRRLKRYLYYYI
ncbi:MAG: hypothetical protein L3J17_05710 [Candidatus Jettenia sp.]|nr:MAG: hypothetical protein L3J17_05710 [Candidatus Jettenia sp.]